MGEGVKEEFNDSNDLLLDENRFEKKNFNSKFIALISGIPRFNLNKRKKSEEITKLGLRHHAGESIRPERKTIYEYM